MGHIQSQALIRFLQHTPKKVLSIVEFTTHLKQDIGTVNRHYQFSKSGIKTKKS